MPTYVTNVVLSVCATAQTAELVLLSIFIVVVFVLGMYCIVNVCQVPVIEEPKTALHAPTLLFKMPANAPVDAESHKMLILLSISPLPRSKNVS